MLHHAFQHGWWRLLYWAARVIQLPQVKRVPLTGKPADNCGDAVNFYDVRNVSATLDPDEVTNARHWIPLPT